ncbi:sigma-70 family RNA polymerase sigma factor [Clostridium sp.]|uniref:sigma-70 family RNA polymerase sigma factor n=1 Tax=Clostridium sp. TaxID=1506 RepID=UPI003F39212A
MDWIIRAKKGDKKAREQLYEICRPLIKSVCNNYYVIGYDNEDLEQIATIVFLKVIDGFNIDAVHKRKYNLYTDSYEIIKYENIKNSDIEWIAFLAYLKRAIKNRIIDEIRKEEKRIYMNYSKSSISKNKVINVKENSKDRHQVERHKCIRSNLLLNLDLFPSLEESYIEREKSKEIRDILKGLSIKEKKLINSIYNEGISLREYSIRENITYNNAYYFRRKLLKKLKILLYNI